MANFLGGLAAVLLRFFVVLVAMVGGDEDRATADRLLDKHYDNEHARPEPPK